MYLFVEPVIWSKKSIALAVDGRRSTPSNCVHFPVGVVIVYHVEVTKSTSAYSNKKNKKITSDEF